MGRGFGRFGTQVPAARALPGSLNTAGASFVVTWSAEPQQQDPGYYNPSYGYGGGYGGPPPYGYQGASTPY
jgi:hypothetical protein